MFSVNLNTTNHMSDVCTKLFDYFATWNGLNTQEEYLDIVFCKSLYAFQGVEYLV